MVSEFKEVVMACFTACVAEALVAYGVKKVVAKSNHQKVRAFSGKNPKAYQSTVIRFFFIVN